MNELTTILTDVRMLLATVVLAFGSCLQVGCSDAAKVDQMIRVAQEGGARIHASTPTQAAIGIHVLGGGFEFRFGSQGNVTITADYSRPAKSAVTALEPVLGCLIPEDKGGGCDEVVPSVCGRIGGAVVPSCPPE